MNNIKCIKTLQRGGKSKYVKLCETVDGTKIIKKAYDKKQQKQIFRFNKEVEFLTHLKNCPFVPKIIAIENENLVIYMSYVGKPINVNHKIKMQERMKSLHLDWNLMRHRKNQPNYNIYIGNATIMNDEIYIIDFGSPHYKTVGPPK